MITSISDLDLMKISFASKLLSVLPGNIYQWGAPNEAIMKSQANSGEVEGCFEETRNAIGVLHTSDCLGHSLVDIFSCSRIWSLNFHGLLVSLASPCSPDSVNKLDEKPLRTQLLVPNPASASGFGLCCAVITMSEEASDSALQLRPLPPHSLEEIGVFEFLDIDKRPTFVIDLSDPENQNDKSVNIVRSNQAFRNRGLLDAIRSSTGDFKAWITCTEAGSDTICIPYTYSGLKWTSYTLRQKWRFICGDGDSQNITCPKPSSYSNSTRYGIVLLVVAEL